MKCYKLRWIHPGTFAWTYSVVSYDLVSAQERLAQGYLPDAEIVQVWPGTNDVIEVL